MRPLLAGIEVPEAVAVTIDGRQVMALPGEMVAAALLAAGRPHSGASFVAGLPRGAFCFMGVCQSCLVEVDGERRRGCVTPVRAGMRIVTGVGA